MKIDSKKSIKMRMCLLNLEVLLNIILIDSEY